jgi:ribosomal protein S18 acetylase RimI-like enzyme
MIASAEFRDLRSIRPAVVTDAAALAGIRNAWSTSAGGGQAEALGLLMDEVDFLNRLAIPHGEDYFCFVAETNGELLGYVIGGGSRDLDRKAHGEIYEIATRRDLRDDSVASQLLGRAFENFDEAEVAGTQLSTPAEDHELCDLALHVDMREDPPRDERTGVIRYERPLRGSAQGPK